jgi:signal transduction histidine kinase
MDLGPLPRVTCYAAKINQVVMNLLTNAIDACPDGGTVTVRTRAEDPGVRIEVADNGCGIDPEHRDRIFDPFFTTKPVGQGTGLGLSISYGIIQDHGGTIEVESTIGQGTVFTIHLPLRPNPAPKDGRRHDAPGEVQIGVGG